MMSKSCNCNPKKVVPSKHFYAKGRADVFMVISMDAYLTEETRENLDRVKGGRAFAAAISSLVPQGLFVQDREEEKILDSGHDFQVFRRHLIHDWFSTTYYFQKELISAPDDPALVNALDKYDVRIRLSRSGFLEIKLTRKTRKEGERIIEILRDLMELRLSPGIAAEEHSTMLKLALFCADRFIENLPPEVVVNDGAEQVLLTLNPLGPNPAILPYRQRYVTLYFEEIFCTHCRSRRIEADKLRQDYMGFLAAMVEGVLVQEEDGTVNFPIIDEDTYKNIDDLASWKNDLCIFAPERSLIYFPNQKIFISGRDGTKATDYKYYWECICRGIEHTVVLRTALQSIAYSTTEILENVPRLTEKVVDGDISKDDTREILQMAQSFSYAFKTLPFLRDILVPSSTFRASYAVNKFERLNKELHISEVREYVERNVDELVSFVQFFSSMELQNEISGNQNAVDRAGFLIAIVAFAATAPSFLKDYHDYIMESKNTSFVNFILYLYSDPAAHPMVLFVLLIGLVLSSVLFWNLFGAKLTRWWNKKLRPAKKPITPVSLKQASK